MRITTPRQLRDLYAEPTERAQRKQLDALDRHCKAFMRSRLWSKEARIQRERLPTMNQMIHEQIGLDTPPETQAQMLQRYLQDL